MVFLLLILYHHDQGKDFCSQEFILYVLGGGSA